MNSTTTEQRQDSFDYDVVIVGGGPAGCSAGVFTARYDLNTAIFDRGRSSIQRCAFLENYLGFPIGIDVETFYALMHDHATEAGCEYVPDLVESVTRTDDGDGFVVEPQEGDSVTAAHVIAATRYDGEYLRPLGGDEMFEIHEYDGEAHERFDRSYPEGDGTTPIDGLYIASPTDGADRQAIIAAGRGASVALALVDHLRHERGYFESFARHRDWRRREAERTEEWSDRDRWREYAETERPDEHEVDEEEWIELREEEIDRRFATYLSEKEIAHRTERGQVRLLEQIDDELIVEYADGLTADSQPCSD